MTLLLATTLLCAAAEVDGTATDEDEIDGIDYQDSKDTPAGVLHRHLSMASWDEGGHPT
jgi:hypothetical protein